MCLYWSRLKIVKTCELILIMKIGFPCYINWEVFEDMNRPQNKYISFLSAATLLTWTWKLPIAF